MSTLGGNKGDREKNPNKPKFAALDINSLYRTSRGESFEPATQKNAAPRKHGMQSLGKVPSARRPPANLPSLKAETSTPANSQAQTTEQQTPANSSSSTASWAASTDSNSNQSSSAGSNITSINLPGGGGGGGSNNSASSQNQATNSSNSSWSAVATGGNVKEENSATSQPPLYQSPQFQNEFPSLGDGGIQLSTGILSTNANANAMKTTSTQNQNSFDSGGSGGGGICGGVALRPSTDAASWMQQQQQSNSANSGNVRGGGGENGGNQQQGNFTTDLNGPPTVMALMPSFLRGANTGIGNINSSSGTNQTNLIQKSSSSNNARERGGGGGRYNNNSSYNNDYVNNNNNSNMPPRHRQQQQPPPRLSGRQSHSYHHQQQNNDDRNSSYEPEVIQQRPIIKEEELERIDSLARDDAWSKHDEIDYNRKLQFSDDETDDVKPKEMINIKTDAWEKKQQQNGPRSLDPLYVEKIKMVREEEDRKERERKTAAQRKLQELDEKSKQKHHHEMGGSVVEEKTSSGIGYTINTVDTSDKRDYNKSKYINDKYDYDYGRSSANGSKSSFQSNLPPRFQKQQQHMESRRDDDRRVPLDKNSTTSLSSSSTYKPLHQQDSKNVPFSQHPYEQQQQQLQQRWVQYNNKTNQPPPRRNMSSLSQSSSDDNRQQNSSKPYNSNTNDRRRRLESEEDEYGRYGGKDMKQKSSSTSAQITRSMSDSSDKLSDHIRSEKSTSREYLGSNVCWAEVCENDKRSNTNLDVSTSSNISTKDRRRVSESSAMSDDQPRTILQRNKPLPEQLQAKNTTATMLNKEKENILVDDDKNSVLNDGKTVSTLQGNITAANVVGGESDDKKKDKLNESDQQQASASSKKSLEIIPEKDQNASEKLHANENIDNKDTKKDSKDSDDRHANKRSPRYESSSSSARGRGGSNYGSYRGGNSWQGGANRRGGHSRGGNRYDYSDSEYSEDDNSDYRSKNSGAGSRKDLHHRRENYSSNIAQKEGFSPRGEPSRRGRGSSMSGSNFHRNSMNAPVKRIDNYGPPSSKSPFGSNDEKSSSEKQKNEATSTSSKDLSKNNDDDRIKQKQKALSDGLINKSMKDNSNAALQKSSSPGGGVKEDSITSSSSSKHSTEQSITFDQKDKKGSSPHQDDDKASIDSKGGRSSNYNTSRKYDKNISQQQFNVTKTSTQSTSASHYTTTTTTSASMQQTKAQQDSRGGGNYRGNSRNDGPNSTNNNNNNNSNRMAAPRYNSNTNTNNSNNNNNANNKINRALGGNSYWDKNHPDSMHDDGGGNKMSLMQQLNASNQNMQQMSTNVAIASGGKTEQVMNQQATMLDGASLPKTTLIFENTSLRTGPPPNNPAATAAGLKRPNVPPSQMQSSMKETTINEMIEQQNKEQQSLTSALQNLSFGSNNTGNSGGGNAGNNSNVQQKNDMVDMNTFKFSFDTQLTQMSQLTDDSSFGQSSSSAPHPSQTKTSSSSSSLGLVGAKTAGMQNSNILNTDSLNMKVAACKKVWEEPSDHGTLGGNSADDVMANFVAQQHLQQYNNINAHHTALSSQSFGYNTGSSNDHTSSLDQHFVSKSNVVDNDDGSGYSSQQQQHMNAHVMHSQQSQMKAAEAFATNANVCKVKPSQLHPSGLSPPPQMQAQQQQQQQQQSQMQHQQTFYPTPNYPNMSTIPSPPVVYNASQSTGGLYSYNAMDAARAQMYGYQASAGANNSFNINAFMQASAAPTHEVYQNISQYRAAVQPFNQTPPQLNNPNAVLISSSTGASNSMMNSKSNTQIGAIGSKSTLSTSGPPPQSNAVAAAATGNPYNQQYMSHLYHQHANSYYPNSTAQQANPYYNTSGSAAAASGSYGMFGSTQQQQMPNYGSVGQYPLNSQMLNSLVINQQYRGGPVVNQGGGGNSNGASVNNASGSSGAGGGNASSGYMKQQQHQSQLQDPNQMKISSMNDMNKLYNWDSSFPSPIQRPTTHQHYQQPRSQKSNVNNTFMSSNQQHQGSKSQFFNSNNNNHMNSSK